ncbi:MAG: hypothetical protein JKY08_02600 [Flavobacteriaceae bacterium]|nr:hypothetical protein [Flavobacteriaceae bacterium]
MSFINICRILSRVFPVIGVVLAINRNETFQAIGLGCIVLTIGLRWYIYKKSGDCCSQNE